MLSFFPPVRKHDVAEHLPTSVIGPAADTEQEVENSEAQSQTKARSNLRPSHVGYLKLSEAFLIPPRFFGNYIYIVSLTGDVYELTLDDARTAVALDGMCGKIWLTDPHNDGSSPFITLRITHELSKQLATRRPQVM